MPQKHQKKKSRLDKFYYMAKEHGYRSRASFKLIQINKKYDILSKSKCIIDLCAAPGGWLQVCAKYMPPASIKIGVDLDPIKQIKGCVTFQQDITTPKCLALLKKEMKHFKADAVLNDGAPNVGQEWSKDAFTQAELSLYALKIATETLRKGGSFVTKLFRSRDYNSLLFVLNHLFTKVEANKPQASRSQSAEIFVVCLGYKAPDYIDPKFLDPKTVFEEIEDEHESTDKISSIKKLMATKKKSRNGYGDRTILYEEADFYDFMEATDPYQYLSTMNKFNIDAKTKAEILPRIKAPKDFELIIQDIKVLGKREMEALLRFRYKWVALKSKEKKEAIEKIRAQRASEVKELNEEEQEEANEKELQDTILRVQKEQKKREKKMQEKQLRNDITQKMSALTSVDINAGQEEIQFGRTFKKLQEQKIDIEEMSFDENESEDDFEAQRIANLPAGITEEDLQEPSGEDESAEDSDEERARHLDAMERGINTQLNLKKAYDHSTDKNKLAKDKRRQALIDMQRTERVDTWTEKMQNQEIMMSDDETGVPNTQKRQKLMHVASALAEDTLKKSALKKQTDEFDEKQAKKKKSVKIVEPESEEEEPLNAPVSSLFVNPLASKKTFLEDLESASDDSAKDDKKKVVDEDGYEWSDDSEMGDDVQGKKKKKKVGVEKKEKDKFEEVPMEQFDEDGMEKKTFQEELDGMDSDEIAETRAIAKRMLRKKEREEIINSSYNRYSNVDEIEALPDWFLEDESKHYRPNIPITKEEAMEEKRALKEYNARPIKKVAEAKMRKKKKMQIALNKLKNKAQTIATQEISENSKAKQITKLYSKQLKKKKEDKKYVVNKSFSAPKGKLNAVRGVKMVDSRMKKDVRSQRIKKKKKGGQGMGKSAFHAKKSGGSKTATGKGSKRG